MFLGNITRHYPKLSRRITIVDIDSSEIEALKLGRVPIFEPGLEDIVVGNYAKGNLDFTTDVAKGVAFGEIIFIAVGTPSDEDGSADLQYVLAVADSIGQKMDDYKIIIDKSTVPVGTAERVRTKVNEVLSDRNLSLEFDVVSNPSS